MCAETKGNDLELREYQNEAAKTDQNTDESKNGLLLPSIGLASEIGALVSHVKKRFRDGDAHEMFSDHMVEELGDVLWYTANLATRLDLSLDEVAARNLRKTQDRWPLDDDTPKWTLADVDFPEDERLPRVATVRVEQADVDGRQVVSLFGENGNQLGNDLTDNAYEDDGYRFHDIFHLTYAALLGWSPVTRALFNCKRNSDKVVREVEDGGRSVVIEEGIAAFVYNYASQERFLDGVKHVDFELLTTIRSMVGQLEVRDRTARDWENAILRSYEIWRQVNENAGGTVHLDLHERTIEFEAA